MYKLQYFKIGSTLYKGDFKNKLQTIYINPQQISSVSGILNYFEQKDIEYAHVTMQNRDIFYINKEEQLKLMEFLKYYFN